MYMLCIQIVHIICTICMYYICTIYILQQKDMLILHLDTRTFWCWYESILQLDFISSMKEEARGFCFLHSLWRKRRGASVNHLINEGEGGEGFHSSPRQWRKWHRGYTLHILDEGVDDGCSALHFLDEGKSEGFHSPFPQWRKFRRSSYSSHAQIEKSTQLYWICKMLYSYCSDKARMNTSG